MSIVLGIDQSLRCTGLFLLGEAISKSSVIKPGKLRGGERLLFVKTAVLAFIQNTSLDLIVLEGYAYFGSGMLAELGELGGIIKLLATELKIPYIAPAPTAVKKFWTGFGGAEKISMVESTNRKLRMTLVLKDNDLADAAALAHIGQAYLNPTSHLTRAELEVIQTLRGIPKTVRRKKKQKFISI